MSELVQTRQTQDSHVPSALNGMLQVTHFKLLYGGPVLYNLKTKITEILTAHLMADAYKVPAHIR